MKTTTTRNHFDLEERTAVFGEQVIELCKQVPRSVINNALIYQLIKSATSCGANYCEANNSSSKRDFRHKISICKKESREAKHFMRMLAKAEPNLKAPFDLLLDEAMQLNLIFSSIYLKST